MNKLKCYIMTELRFLKELILIERRNQKEVIFVTTAILSKDFKF